MRSKIARLFVWSIICLVLAPTGVSQVIRSADPVPGEYIVTFEPDATNPGDLANDVSRAAGVTPRFVYKHAIKGFSFRGSEARAVALSRHPSVGFVFEATKMYPGGSGTQFSPPWGLDRIDARTGFDGMFTYGYSGAGVVAYVIDSGINATAGIPAGRIREHREFVGTETRTDDCAGHGTYVAEVLGGATYGVAKDVVFVNYRVLDCTNGFAVDGDVVAGIDAMVGDHNSRPGQLAVANLSLFTYGHISTVIDSAVGRAVSAGITVVTIAGNIVGGSPSNDACTISPGHLGASTAPNGIITVGGTRSDDVMNPGSKGGPCVDLFAPGHQIPVAPGLTFSGTSFAAPHVAGVVALNLERKVLLAPIYRTPMENENDVKAMATPGVLFNLTTGSPNLLVYSRWAKRRACCG